MGRIPTILLFIVSMVIVGAGAFYAGAAIVTPPLLEKNSTSATILEEGKKRIPAPTLPPKPGGREVVETNAVQRVIQVPRTTTDFQTVGLLGFKIPITKTIVENQTIIENVPTTKLVDATPAETAEWEAQVKKLQDTYNAELNEEIKKISDEQFLQKSKDAAQRFKTFVSDVIVPILLSLAGLVGAIIGLIQAFKTRPRDQVT
jgi:hypothetical protein